MSEGLDEEYLEDEQDIDDNWLEDTTSSTASSKSNEIPAKAGAIKPPKKKQTKPKVTAEWSEEDVFKLIGCVELVPMLWNAKDEKYRNKIERTSAWNQMSEIYFENKFSGSELLAKWSNVRIQYRGYFTKYHKTKSGQGADEPVEAVKWKFYEAMGFVGRAEDEQTGISISNLVCVYHIICILCVHSIIILTIFIS